jgi:hypothetical protein
MSIEGCSTSKLDVADYLAVFSIDADCKRPLPSGEAVVSRICPQDHRRRPAPIVD